MKKFITYISRQKGDALIAGVYQAQGNEKLQLDFPVHFPVITMMGGYILPDEEVELLLIYDRGNTEYESNRRVLEEDLAALQEKVPFRYRVTPMEISEEEFAYEHLKTFSALLSHIKDGDELYVCVTYGSKPTPVVEMMSLTFAYRIRRNVAVGCIVYGRMDHHHKPAPRGFVYDITPLFHMIQITNRLAESGVEEPEKRIRALLDLDED